MRGSNHYDTPHRFGFRMLEVAERQKYRLAASGEAGMHSLIYACIASGINTDEAIFKKADSILGKHGEKIARRVLFEGEQFDWECCDDDTFTVRLA